MGPSDIVHKVLVSGIAFTVIVAALLMAIAYVGYSSEVMHANLRRIMSSGLVIICLIGAIAAVFIFFPHQVATIVDSLSAMASRR